MRPCRRRHEPIPSCPPSPRRLPWPCWTWGCKSSRLVFVYLVGRGLGGRGPASALLATKAFASLPTVLPRVAAPAALRDLSDATGSRWSRLY